ncbi:hypothetical protein [Amycolatopsis aidingensis]|uniref:hypothetical protein n=1 Tax=Amycolatopsis aidingensis TaxID=2842453 RepID=UPI001E5306A5|nr:hypothetical protein [Amycolatopsis aidingensis]
MQLLTGNCELLAADRGYTDVCIRDLGEAPAIEQAKRHAATAFTRIVERARESGQLRGDFAESDLTFAMASVARTAEPSCEFAPQAWRRQLGYLLSVRDW